MPDAASRRVARRTRLALTLAVAGLATAGLPAAQAADRVVTVKSDGPGPAKTDKVRVLQQGPASAKKVLLLVPGTSASASYFKPLADSLLPRLPGWQIWSISRREVELEDVSVMDRAMAKTATPQQLFDYYLGWITNSAISDHFKPVVDAEVPYAKEWGMKVAIGDLQKVVALARKGGRKVVLGGHSLGGSIAQAYATWDFRGRAGAKDLAGLVFIDGGGGDGRNPISTTDAQARLDKLATGSPFLDLVGLGLPWAAGVFNAVGARTTLLAPDAPSTFQTWPVLPAYLKPPVPATNAAVYGYALDTETGPKSLALVQMHLGRLADAGDPRPWQDGGLVTVARAAQVFAGIKGMDGSSWYHPSRLSLDAAAVNGGVKNPAQDLLGVPATHGKDVKLPIYAFATSLGNTRVIDSARRLASRSKVPPKLVVLVNRAATNAHIDPIAAPPASNDFIRTVVPFLKRIR
jgi:pimeloyl-ACP methyl ester carboxylesterase